VLATVVALCNPAGVAERKGDAMRRVVLVLASVMTALALATGVALAQAQTFTDSERVPLNTATFNPCTGELVTLAGYLHLLTHTTVDEQGGVHLQSHVNPQQVSGTSTSGTEYRAVGKNRTESNTFSGGLPVEVTHVRTFNFISTDATDNFLLHETIHITINANGEVTAVVENVTTECRG
jgi:hypothetical protein